MKIMVTGGAGFIGSAVIREILSNSSHSVVNVDKLTYAGNLESLSGIEDDSRYFFERVDICSKVESTSRKELCLFDITEEKVTAFIVMAFYLCKIPIASPKLFTMLDRPSMHLLIVFKFKLMCLFKKALVLVQQGGFNHIITWLPQHICH